MARAWLAQVVLATFFGVAPLRASASDITIGVALPLSGPKQALGTGMREALTREADALNAQGGVLGSELRLVFADDGCQSGAAEVAARALLSQAARAVIGHPCSNAAVAAAPLYRAQGTILIAAGPRHSAVTDPRPASDPSAPTVFRLAGRDDRQGDAAALWLLREAPAGRIAIVHDRTGYAREIVEATQRALATAGLKELLVLPIVAAKTDYPDIVDKIRKLGAEAVFFAGYTEEAQIVLDDLRGAGLTMPFLGSDSLATGAFAQQATRSDGRVDVLMRAEPGDPANEGPQSALARRAADALNVWAQAARSANSVEAAPVARALIAGSFESEMMGEVSFDARGDSREQSYGIARASDGIWKQTDK